MQLVITFRRLIQDSQEFGSTNEHMVSRVFFDLETPERKHEWLMCDVKQPVGADFKTDPLEVGGPSGYDGPFDYQSFARAAEAYYRDNVGTTGRAIRLSAGAKSVRRQGNVIVSERVVTLEVPSGGPTGW